MKQSIYVFLSKGGTGKHMIFFLTRHVLFLVNLHDFLTGYQPYYHLKRLLYLWGKKFQGRCLGGGICCLYIILSSI